PVVSSWKGVVARGMSRPCRRSHLPKSSTCVLIARFRCPVPFYTGRFTHRTGPGTTRPTLSVGRSLSAAGSLQRLVQLARKLGGLGGGLAHLHPGGLQRLLLRLRGSGRTGDDRARVAHRLALGRGEPGDVADHGLGDVGLDVLGGALLGVPTDLTDHHDELGLRVGLERLQRVDVRGADDRVATDADGGGDTDVPQLVHHLVGQGAGLRHQTDLAGSGDVGRDDAGVGLSRRDDARAVRTDDPGLVALRARVRPESGRVVHRDALGDHHGEGDLGVDGLDDRVLRELRRHEDHADVGARLLHGLFDGAEDGQVLAADGDGLARLTGVHAADDVGTGRQHLGGVLAALGAGEALDDDLGFAVQENRHVFHAPAAANSAALSAALSIVSTNVTSGCAASVRIRRPSSTLLPSSRTTSGLVALSPRIFSASTMPLATASHAVIPPKTLTNTLLTSGSPRMTSSPAAMTSADAPPPMSRKFAGRTPPCFSPAWATTSSVDMTRPSPLPMMPT